MGASYGLGFVGFYVDAGAPKDEKLDALRALAKAAGRSVCDAFDGVAFDVTPEGVAREVQGELGAAMVAAVRQSRGSAPYSHYKYLDGFVACVDGANETAFQLPNGADSYVGPLEDLARKLDRLLAATDIDPACTDLHRTLLALCDRAFDLGLPVMLGS